EHWGFLEHRQDYDQLLRSADIVVSTALHDFQGLAMLEAMASGCLPLAPDRLAYREYVPADCRYRSLESDPGGESLVAAERLVRLLKKPPELNPPQGWRASELAPKYQALVQQLMARA
ncbi:MAG: glycosyltransferase, partial [Alcanivorax sp.]|nr:glycosyltransferase [Alcanivorax sp.]